MATAAVFYNGSRREFEFEPPRALWDVLVDLGFALSRPCGGRGVCGKCAALISGCVSPPNEAEKRAGARLICQAVLLGDAEITLRNTADIIQIEAGETVSDIPKAASSGDLGAAIDLGTTTLALRLYELETGECISSKTAMNPQASVSADVMGRIDYALRGGLESLRKQAADAIYALIDSACASARAPVERVKRLVITGNTTMLYLLTGRSPESLSRAPFIADHLFDETTRLFGMDTYLPPCAGAFTGADIICAALSTGLCESAEPTLLCDIGTNGEMALWTGDKLYVASTAAGPAFEGAGISCGVGGVMGAVDRVWVEGGRIAASTIGGAAPVGLCGSGLIDAVAALRQLGEIDFTGAIDADCLHIAQGVSLNRQDIRSVQLAKAAIAAGIEALIRAAGMNHNDIRALLIAGGFGSHIDLKSAAAIGLIPRDMIARAKPVGNAAITGAAILLCNPSAALSAREIAKAARHVKLGGDEEFNKLYIENMLFPE